jgi:hypothetical protein
MARRDFASPVKNTWLHSLALIAVAAPVIALSIGVAAEAPAGWSEPARAFALLAPGLALGWFTRRHPLLVGAAAGLLAAAWSQSAPAMLAAAMIVAVAALAGRALRFRFRPAASPGLDRPSRQA